NLKSAATATVNALDAADGATDQTIGGNNVGIVYYRNSSATVAAAVGSSYTALISAIGALPAPTGASPHGAGITPGASALAASASGYAKSMVIVTDGQATSAELASANSAATTAKGNGVRIVPVGIGTGSDVNVANLQGWATSASSYQGGTPGPIDTGK